VQYKLVNNNRDLAIALHNAQGNFISDAKVCINNRNIPFDPATKLYCIGKRKKAGLLKITFHGVLYLFQLSNNNPSYYRSSNWLARVSRSFPLRYIVQPIQKIFRHNNHYNRYYGNQTAYEKKYTGFMVYSKPKYRRADTVQLKAYITNNNGKPVNRPLLVRLSDRSFIEDTILTTLHPYRPGCYEYKFAITDGLDLSLDTDYSITLEELGSKKYNLDEYEGELDDDEYAAKRKVLIRGQFTFEEYDLSGIHFSARTDKEEHARNNPLAVYLKATDENELAVMDGRVQLVVMPQPYASKVFDDSHVFLPDTLWNHIQVLEPAGETKIVIPDSIFPAASFNYNIECIFLNENNDYKTVTLSASYKNNPYSIIFTAEKDSLVIEQRKGDMQEKASGMLYAFNEKDDTMQQQPIQLPATVPLNSFAKYYEMQTDSADEKFNLADIKNRVNCVARRTADSVSLQVINPARLHFWYTIFAGNRVLQRGYSDSLVFIAKTITPKNYFVSLQYIYGDKVRKEEYTIPYQDRLLDIQVNQPGFVYPGKRVSIDIFVTSKKGKPVNNADVTAYSYTDKFENKKTPYVPYLGKIYGGRRTYRNFSGDAKQDKSGEGKLNWERWSREMGLDSIEYFKFLHPITVYTNTEPAPDGITQLAPFIVLHGDLQPVQQVYIDEVPYFFNQAQQLQRYSFSVAPGKHALRLRTNNRLIKIDSVWAFKGVKTFISINADTAANKAISLVKMPDSLNNYEKVLWSKYMILLENNFVEAPATIEQNQRLYLLNPPQPAGNIYSRYNSNLLAGPFLNQQSVFNIKNQFSQSFEPEGNYLYNFSKSLIKQKQLPYSQYSFSPRLSGAKPLYNFRDFVLTQKNIDSIWQDYLDHRNANEDLFRNESLGKTGNGRLQINAAAINDSKTLFVKNVFLFRYDDPDFVRVYKGAERNLGYVQPGSYRVFLLLNDNRYFLKDSIEIIKDGINYYQVAAAAPLESDTVSMRIARIVNSQEKKWVTVFQEQDLAGIKETFNEKYLDGAGFTGYISGTVLDEKTGSPLPGAMVTIKGTKFGTTTDSHGAFNMKVPAKGTIFISMVGYESIEKRISESQSYTIKLRLSSAALSDVVVVGYGVQRKKDLTGAVSVVSGENALMGQMAGLQVTIRGIGTTATGDPLLIVDGIPFQGKLGDIDKTLIVSINIMKPAEATGIYGSMAANGVIIITTKKTVAADSNVNTDPVSSPGNIIRRRFRDDAYWQPSLHTDKEGRASFTVTFPDDITRWQTFVIATADKKQTGFAQGFIKSFKAISAGLAMPQFVIEGDSLYAIGKTLNYTMDSMRVKKSFSINDSLRMQTTVALQHSSIDTFGVAVSAADSIKLKYTIEKDDGYFDGEERTIPVFKQGVLETKGYFAALEADTSFSISFDTAAGKIKLYAETSVLPVILDEIERIHRYEYFCNEQLASKLKALLLKKKIYQLLKRPFEGEKAVNGIIAKLNQAKSSAGLWGWWNNNEPSLWISLHVIEALLLAEKDGYAINMNKDIIKDYLIYINGTLSLSDRITCLNILQLLKAKVIFSSFTDSLETRIPLMTLQQHLQLLEQEQQLGMPVNFDTLQKKYRTTMLGNMYWGEDNNRFFDNSIENTLLMYRLMRVAGGYNEALQKARNYFLERRGGGQWRNTYEASLILETILPDILKNESLPVSPSLTLNDTAIINTFPWSGEIKSAGKLLIKKKGTLPLYFTAYQQYWNARPSKVAGDFRVNSYFETNGEKRSVLKAGGPVIMKVDVQVRADAEYVMIEIPVPAGCFYKDKTQEYGNNEVHREYFKNKVSIFCSSLRKGSYTFSVSLLPRFTGNFCLNPAKAEMMYFPVFYGREELKKVKIGYKAVN